MAFLVGLARSDARHIELTRCSIAHHILSVATHRRTWLTHIRITLRVEGGSYKLLRYLLLSGRFLRLDLLLRGRLR